MVTCYQTGGAEWVVATAQGDNQGAASKLGTFPPSWPRSVGVLLGRVEASLPQLLRSICLISAGYQERDESTPEGLCKLSPCYLLEKDPEQLTVSVELQVVDD